jgi:hypothetical protein
MTRARLIGVAVGCVTLAAAGLIIGPESSLFCRGPACNHMASANWDFSTSPERKVLMFPSQGGLAIPPG